MRQTDAGATPFILFEALLSLVTYRKRFLPHRVFALTLFGVAALWAGAAGTLLEGSIGLYDLWGYPPRSFVELAVMIELVAASFAGAGVFVIVRGWVDAALTAAIAGGLLGALAITYRVYTAACHDLGRLSRGLSVAPDQSTAVVPSVSVPLAMLACVLCAAVAFAICQREFPAPRPPLPLH